MALKDRLKSARLAKGLTLDDVSTKVGVSRQTIQRYESGVISNIPSDNIEKLATALDTTPAELMGWNIGAVKVTTKMSFDNHSPMHALTQAYLRHPPLVRDEIIRRLEGLDATFSNNVSKLLQASGDINSFIQGTGLSFATVGKFMQGETVLTTPTEAERIATYFHTNVVDLFFGADTHLEITDTVNEEEYPPAYTENLSSAIAGLLTQEISLSMKSPNNTTRVLIALTNYLNTKVEKPTYQRTKRALDIINSDDFADILDRTIFKFNKKYPCAPEVNTLAALIAKEVYDSQSVFLIAYSSKSTQPVKNLVSYLASALDLDK